MKPAADEFEVIARRLKEIEAEKVTAPLPDDLPSDVEPISMKKAYTIDEYWQAVRDIQAKSVPSIYGDPFWDAARAQLAAQGSGLTTYPLERIVDALVRNGVIKVVEA
jgi:hypothetical protein